MEYLGIELEKEFLAAYQYYLLLFIIFVIVSIVYNFVTMAPLGLLHQMYLDEPTTLVIIINYYFKIIEIIIGTLRAQNNKEALLSSWKT